MNSIEGRSSLKLRIERDFMKDFDKYDDDIKVEIISIFGSISGNRNGGSKKFWEFVAKKISNKELKMKPFQAVDVFKSLALTQMLSQEIQKVLNV